MNPSIRLLEVMEYLMAAGPNPVKQIDISRDLNISAATVNRIVKALSDRGYIFRTKEKYCVKNFRLIRSIPMSEEYLSALQILMDEITNKHKVAVEAVVVSGFDLLWHSRTHLPNATVTIRAGAGFKRNLYELDALARLYLSRVGWDEVSYKFHSGGFFKTGIEMESLSPEDARKIIENENDSTFAYDMNGNHLGVRRFATIIEDEKGNFIHMLSLAEAAIPINEEERKISESKLILSEAKKLLEQKIKQDLTLESEGTIKHEISPPHIN